jgi:FixJ family two-component response regulator
MHDASPSAGRFSPSTDLRHHVFLLVAPAEHPARIGGDDATPHTRVPMTERSSGFVVAVVDDDLGVLRSLEYLLESADYPVRVFASGAALLESGCLSEIACLISDIDMPGMDGFEVLRLVHAIRPELPTFLITGYPDTLKRLPLLGASTPRVFTKPFEGRELLGAVSDAVRGSPE